MYVYYVCLCATYEMFDREPVAALAAIKYCPYIKRMVV